MSSSLQKLEEVKQIIRSLLVSEPDRDITLEYLSRLYYEMIEEKIPFNNFDYTSLKDFLNSMPDVVHLYYKNDRLYVEHVASKKSEHISVLVKKAKKHTSDRKIKSMNLIDPSLLYKVLKDLMIESKNDQNCVSKYDVISKVNCQTDEHTYYTIPELSSQLHQFTHILTHDDDYIYFKEQVVMEDHNYSCDMDLSVSGDSVGNFIRDKTKTRLIKLMEKYPDGIWCSDLPTKYQQEYKVDLEYSEIGFNSIVEFVAALPNIFHIITPPNANKQMVLDSRKPLKEFQTFQSNNRKARQIIEYSEASNDAIPTSVSFEVAESLMPDDVMTFYDTTEVIKVESIHKDQDKYIDVIVSEVLHPSFFWIILRENKKILSKLMGELEEFYSQQDLDTLRIPQILLQPGFHVACRSGDMWHRGILKRIRSTDTEVLLYDSGSTDKLKTKNIYYLHKKFMSIPAQAIPCGIHDVKPKDKNKWLTPVCKKFLNRIFDKAFIAEIKSINQQGNSIMVNLIDVSRDDCEVKIDQWLIDQRLADRGETICKKLNPTFDHYQLCTFKNDPSSFTLNDNTSQNNPPETEITNEKNKSARGKVSTLTYLSTREKLEALRKYKARYSGSSEA